MRNKVDLVLKFSVYRGDDLVARHHTSEDIVKLGRDPSSHVCVEDVAVARMHAVIEVAGRDAITLIDLGHGTRVNGVCIDKCKLHPGDSIEVGEARVVLESIDHPAARRVAQAVPYEPSAFVRAANPFLVAAPAPAARAEGSYEYRLIPQAPPPLSEEVETDASAVEVRVLWGRNVVHVSHHGSRRAFHLGPDPSDADFVVPEGLLPAGRTALVSNGRALVLPGATVSVTIGDRPAMGLEQALAGGLAERDGVAPLAIALGAETTVRQQLGELGFEVRGVKQGKRAAASFGLAALASGAAAYVLGSFVGHAGLLAALAMLMPPLGATGDDNVNDEQRYLIQQYLESAATHEQDERPTEQLADDKPTNDEGGTGQRAKLEEGSLGDPSSNASNRRWAAAGDAADPVLARQAALRDAASFGVIGLLASLGGGDPAAPTVPWGGLSTEGKDPLSAQGNMWGDEIGAAYGAGGLGLTGIGEGGGGLGEGIGIGTIGTYGHGSGRGDGMGFGDGRGSSLGRISGGHQVRAPNVRIGATTTIGRLPPEVIQRIVRANFGRFRNCYQTALRTNPSLAGRVSVRFVIGHDGRVSNVGAAGDLRDNGVTSCVARSFYGLSFPQPEGGIVTVAYPIVFTPGS